MKVSRKQIEKWWEFWELWRLVGMRVEAFVLAIGWDGPLPRGMLDTFFEIDDMYGRMERKFLKELTKKKK